MLSFDEMVATAQATARELARDDSRVGQDIYLYQLAAVAMRLRDVPERPLFSMGKTAPGVSLAPAFRGVPFFVIEWRMAPNAYFPAHDHPGYSVCTVGLAGEAEVEHFEMIAPAKNDQAQIRRTRRAVIEPGRADTLSAQRDNIHQFRAGSQGARGIDITTLYGVDTGFHWIDIERDDPAMGVAIGARLRAAKST